MAGEARTTRRPEAGVSLLMLPLPPGVIAAGVGAVAVLVGALLAYSPTLGLGLVAAILFVPLALTNLPLAIALWVPLVAIEYSQVAGPAPYLSTLLIVAAFVGGRLHRRRQGEPAPASPGLWAWALGGFLLWIALSALWAEDSGVSLERLREYVVAGAVLTAIAVTLVLPRHIAFVALAFVAGTGLSVIVGLVGLGSAVSTTANAIDTATRERLSGGAGDPNSLAAMLVPAIALALGLLSWYRDPVVRLGLIVGVLVMSYGLILTQSRGGFLAALVAVAVSVVIARRRRRALAGAVAALCVAGACLYVAPGALERITTYDGGGTGRLDLWTVAWRMVEDHPVQGVGLGNYVVRSRDYALLHPGTLEFSELIVDKAFVTHNVYLQTLAEVGFVGLALLLAALAACLGAGLAAIRRFERSRQTAMATLARAIVAGTAGSLVASIFISNTTDKRLFALLALGPALLLAGTRPAKFDHHSAITSR